MSGQRWSISPATRNQPEARIGRSDGGLPMMVYRVLADLVVVLHAAFVVFVVVGEVAVLYGLARGRGWARAFWFRWLHLASIAFVVLLSWLGATCPLTEVPSISDLHQKIASKELS